MLTSLGQSLRAEERVFDEAAALRRLAGEAGYRTPPPDPPSAVLPDLPAAASRQLTVVVSWGLEQPGAVEHVERLAEAIGERRGTGIEDSWMLLVRLRDLAEIDVDGAHVFACMLHQAQHHESAQFWWQFAAGAGKGISAFCLHLHHLSRGEIPEAQHWFRMLAALETREMLDAVFFRATRQFAAWQWRHGKPAIGQVPALTDEVHRLATLQDADEVLVCRPDHELALRLQESA
ncbi:hypothetical protein FM076_00785 [Streptomyces albus subsp. chlorinus]|nr:hypothetical protein [Streptomyces albus]NSC19828.1 hypothetical protein [Streptomyces albus subsp. chlorinus]